MLFRLLVIACAAAAAGCAGYKRPLPRMTSPRPAAHPVPFVFSDRSRQLKFTRLVSDLPVGHQYGEEAGEGCMRRQPLFDNEGRHDLDAQRYTPLFNDVMKQYGYPVDDQVELFPGTKERVADVQVAAKMTDLIMNVCYPRFFDLVHAIGSAYVKLEWSLYVPMEQKVVLVVTTEGSTYGDVESSTGEGQIFRPALEDAIRRLAESAAYRAVIDPPAHAAK
jgi:hypothetical protein